MKYLAFLIVLFLSPAAMAQEMICDKLKQEETYKNWQSYRYLVEGDEGWVFRTEIDFQDDFAISEKDVMRLKSLNDAFAAQDTMLILSILPTRGITDGNHVGQASYDRGKAQQSYTRLIGTLRDAGLSVAAVDSNEKTDDFYYKRDHHWTPTGARMMAQAVAAQVKSKNISLQQKRFVTEAQGAIDHVGTFGKFIKEACGLEVSPEQVSAYVTYAPEDTGALFDDVATPEVVLLGTSNSTNDAAHANYDGFLKEALQADVDNRAISGGGADAAMLQYLAARPAEMKKPRVIVWEFPIYHGYESKNFLRQATPSVGGACANPVAEKEIAVAPFMTPLENLKDRKIQGPDYYLHLTLTPPTAENFRVVNVWDDGNSDFFTFKRDPFYTPDGIYYLDMEAGKPSLAALKLQFPENVTGTVKVSLCRK